MLNSEDIRKRLINFISNEGITQLFICKKCGINTCTLSKYKKGTDCLKNDKLKELSEYLSSKGY